MKIIYNPEYSGSELIKDPVGMELVCEKEEDIPLLLNHFYTTLFHEKINKMKSKGFNIKKLLKNNRLTEPFKKILEKA
jgi:hypothetical protein